jgi:hypothetical protein
LKGNAGIYTEALLKTERVASINGLSNSEMDRIKKYVNDDYYYYYRLKNEGERLFQKDYSLKEPIKQYIADEARVNEFLGLMGP